MDKDLDLQTLAQRIDGLEAQLHALRANMPRSNKATLIVFSGELDKALAALVIATAAASMAIDTSVFFTFWGINILRERRLLKGKEIHRRLIDCLTPAGPNELPISHMHMLGAGTALLKKMMDDKHLLSVEEFLALAVENHVRLYVCSMSMDALGIDELELMQEVQMAGVATYLQEARQSAITLFI
jgi:peroxiredoxin family protein